MTVLNKTPIHSATEFVVLSFIVLLLAALLAFMWAADGLLRYKVLLFVVLFSAFALAVILPRLIDVANDKCKYEVVFDDGSGIEEFISRYEVLEQRGRVWVVRDK